MKYLIKHVIISLYNLQANKMIKKNHQLIIDTLFKLMNDFIRYDQNDWVTHFFSVLLVNQTIIRMSTEMTSFYMMYEYEMILSIKLDVLTWQILLWNTVKTHSDLIVMQAWQIKKHNKDIKKTCAHLWQMRLQEKKYYNQTKNIISKILKKNDLILLHDMQNVILYSTVMKMKFQWNDLYCIWEMISDKDSYFLEKLNETVMKSSVHGNRLKKFWLWDLQFDILKNDEASENDDWDSDIDILKMKDNDQDWISKKEEFAVII